MQRRWVWESVVEHQINQWLRFGARVESVIATVVPTIQPPDGDRVY